jgi:hypothetical protein
MAIVQHIATGKAAHWLVVGPVMTETTPSGQLSVACAEAAT